MERDAEVVRDRLEPVVVAHDERDVAGQLALLVADEQVVEAVVGLAHEDREPLAIGVLPQAPSHAEPVGELGHARVQLLVGAREAVHVEADALKELARIAVEVLVGLEDVGAELGEPLGQGGDEAGAVGAADEEGGGGGHGPTLTLPQPGDVHDSVKIASSSRR